MTQYYVGIKIVQAWKEAKDGKEGYAVKYPDGYISWSPKEVFEGSYLAMGENNNNRCTLPMVDEFIGEPSVMSLPDGKTTLVSCKMISGFMEHATSSCVDPANYSVEIGAGLAVNKIKDSLWKLLGFVVQWGKYGIITTKV